MKQLRIANIVAHEDDQKTNHPSSYEIPSRIIGPGFSVGEIALAQRRAMLNDLDRAVLELTYVEAGIRAEKLGYHAIFIRPVADYGIRQMRAAVEIPVVGSGQASMQVAAGLGRKFAIVTVWPEVLRPAYERQLAEYGFQGMCSGIHFVSTMDELPALRGANGLISKLGASQKGPLMDKIEVVAKSAIAGGADVIVLGCTCMSSIRSELADRLGGPIVLDPLTVGYKYTELILSLGIIQPPTSRSIHAENLASMIGGIKTDGGWQEECAGSCSVLNPNDVAVSAD